MMPHSAAAITQSQPGLHYVTQTSPSIIPASVSIILLSSQLTELMFAGPMHVRLSTQESAQSQTLPSVTYSNSLFVSCEKVALCSFWPHPEPVSRLLTWQRGHEETAVFHFLIGIQKGLVKGNGCTFFCRVSRAAFHATHSSCLPVFRSLCPYLSPLKRVQDVAKNYTKPPFHS